MSRIAWGSFFLGVALTFVAQYLYNKQRAKA